jgi:hypothetical protein
MKPFPALARLCHFLLDKIAPLIINHLQGYSGAHILCREGLHALPQKMSQPLKML